jgi:hypothetical protein
MTQTILNLTGIALDFLGFVILLREWWITVFSERGELAFEEMMARQADFEAFALKNANNDRMRDHMERSAKMRADHRLQEFRNQRRAILAARKSLYVIAVVLIVLGSVCQFLGSVPADWLPFALPGA